jgi:hypothetical protein
VAPVPSLALRACVKKLALAVKTGYILLNAFFITGSLGRIGKTWFSGRGVTLVSCKAPTSLFELSGVRRG